MLAFLLCFESVRAMNHRKPSVATGMTTTYQTVREKFGNADSTAELEAAKQDSDVSMNDPLPFSGQWSALGKENLSLASDGDEVVSTVEAKSCRCTVCGGCVGHKPKKAEKDGEKASAKVLASVEPSRTHRQSAQFEALSSITVEDETACPNNLQKTCSCWKHKMFAAVAGTALVATGSLTAVAVSPIDFLGEGGGSLEFYILLGAALLLVSLGAIGVAGFCPKQAWIYIFGFLVSGAIVTAGTVVLIPVVHYIPEGLLTTGALKITTDTGAEEVAAIAWGPLIIVSVVMVAFITAAVCLHWKKNDQLKMCCRKL